MSRSLNGNLLGRAARLSPDEWDLTPEPELFGREKLDMDLWSYQGLLMNMTQFTNASDEEISAVKETISDLEAKLTYGEDWEEKADKLAFILRNPLKALELEKP